MSVLSSQVSVGKSEIKPKEKLRSGSSHFKLFLNNFAMGGLERTLTGGLMTVLGRVMHASV